MEEQRLPKILYKYRSFQENVVVEERYQKKSFADGELYFANHSELNDPFDMKIRKKIETLPEIDKLMHIIFHLAKLDGSRSFSLLLQEAKNIHEMNLKERPDIYKKRSIEAIEKENDAIERGTLCFCERMDDILMWSHYGNSNKGFCLGYNTEKLKEYLIENKYALLGIFRVKYFSEYPEIKPYFGHDIENIRTKLASKSMIWSYEKEWRLIIHNQTSVAIQIPNEIVEEIILGSCVSEDTEKEILLIQREKYPHAKVFKVEPDDSEFKLNVKPYLVKI